MTESRERVADPQPGAGRSAADLESAIDGLRRELGAQRMKQARDQVHQAVAAMDLVYSALSGVVDSSMVVGQVLCACEAVRVVRDRVTQLQQKLEASGGAVAAKPIVFHEMRRRQQQG